MSEAQPPIEQRTSEKHDENGRGSTAPGGDTSASAGVVDSAKAGANPAPAHLSKEQCDHDWSVVAESHGRVVACLKCGRSQDSFTSKPKVRRYSGNAEGMVRIDQFGGEGGFVASEDYDVSVAEIERLRAALEPIAQLHHAEPPDWQARRAREALRPADETVAPRPDQNIGNPGVCPVCGSFPHRWNCSLDQK